MRQKFNVNLEKVFNDEDLNKGLLDLFSFNMELGIDLKDSLEWTLLYSKLSKEVFTLINEVLDAEDDEARKELIFDFEIDLTDFDINHGFYLEISSSAYNLEIDVTDEEVKEVNYGEYLQKIFDNMMKAYVEYMDFYEVLFGFSHSGIDFEEELEKLRKENEVLGETIKERM